MKKFNILCLIFVLGLSSTLADTLIFNGKLNGTFISIVIQQLNSNFVLGEGGEKVLGEGGENVISE